MNFIKTYWKLAIPLILFAIVGALLHVGMNHDPHEIESPLINEQTPEFSIPSLMHPSVILTQKMFLGHVTLLNVFASWCVSCKAEHPVLMDIAKDDPNVVLDGLNYRDEEPEAKAFLNEYGNPYQEILEDSQGQLGINFGVYGTPETFLIDKKGVIRYKQIGPISPEIWKTELLPRVKALEAE